MPTYRARLQYDGSDFFGFQWQKGIASVQQSFNGALQKCVPTKFTTMGASRTDTGVHAFEQFVKITSADDLDVLKILPQLNSYLAPSIFCLELQACAQSFKPVGDCLSKEYRYFFTNLRASPGSGSRFVANNPYELDFEQMRLCTDALVGEHNFHNFYSLGSNVTSTVREITSVSLSEINPHEVFRGQRLFEIPDELKHCYEFRIVGNGFLKQMIRHLVSALWHVGGGRLSSDEFLFLLDGPKKSRRLWKVAHPKGLFLYRVNY